MLSWESRYEFNTDVPSSSPMKKSYGLSGSMVVSSVVSLPPREPVDSLAGDFSVLITSPVRGSMMIWSCDCNLLSTVFKKDVCFFGIRIPGGSFRLGRTDRMQDCRETHEKHSCTNRFPNSHRYVSKMGWWLMFWPESAAMTKAELCPRCYRNCA